METKLFIFLLAVSLCNGHLPFGNILSSAHSKIHEVAGGIIDGIAHGLNINVEGNIGVKTEANHGTHQPNYGSTKPPEETIVVIVEEGANSNNYRPSGNHRPHQNEPRPPYNNNGVYGPGYNEYRPHHHRPGRPQHHGNEDFNNNGNYNNYNQGGSNEYGRPHNNYGNNQYGNKPNRYPNYPNQGYPNGRPQYQGDGNNGPNDQYGGNNNDGYNPRPNFGNNNNGFNPGPNVGNNNNGYNPGSNVGNNNNGYNPGQNVGNNNNGIPTQPPPYNNNNQQNNNENYPNYNDANNGNANPNGNQFNNNPTTEFSTKRPVPTFKPSETSTQPDNDIPLFIPLLPSDSKNLTAPKRETDNKPKPAEDIDEDFELDIRIKE